MVDLITNLRTIRDESVTLVPATAFDFEKLQRVRPDQPLWTHLVFHRSVLENRWYRALVAKVADGLGYIDPESLHQQLKFKAGLIERFYTVPRIGAAVELRSTAFARMDGLEFRQYVNAAIEIIFNDYLPGVRRQNVFAEVEAMVGPRPW